MNRRGFFVTLAAAMFARFKPKPVIDPGPGISINVVRTFTRDGLAVTRFDVLYGIAPVYP